MDVFHNVALVLSAWTHVEGLNWKQGVQECAKTSSESSPVSIFRVVIIGRITPGV